MGKDKVVHIRQKHCRRKSLYASQSLQQPSAIGSSSNVTWRSASQSLIQFMWVYRPPSQAVSLCDWQSATKAAHSVNGTVTPMSYGKLDRASSWDRTPAITKRDALRRTGAYEVREMNGRHASWRISQTRRTNECYLFTLIVVASVFSSHTPSPSRHFHYGRCYYSLQRHYSHFHVVAHFQSSWKTF